MATTKTPKAKGQHPIQKTVAALAAADYDQAHVDLSEYLPDDADRTADLLGVKGPDQGQWGSEARAERGAVNEDDPAADLPRGDG
jgi:hypothetical protein